MHIPRSNCGSKVSESLNLPISNTLHQPVLMKRVTEAEEQSINELLQLDKIISKQSKMGHNSGH